MKEKHVFFLLLLLVMPSPIATQDAPKAAPALASKPSLDLLVARVDDYWRLLLEHKKLQAASYVSPSYLQNFQARTIPPFSDPCLSEIELSIDRTEAMVTVTVKRRFPDLGKAIDWPVREMWAFNDGNWYLRTAPISIPIQSGARSAAGFDAEQLEKQKQELRDILRFEKFAFDFGTVRQGDRASFSLKYSLAGSEPLQVNFEGSIPDLIVSGLKENRLLPGERELTIEVPTWNYDGDVKESFVLVTHRKGVEVPYKFALQGHVYVPVSLAPRVIRFRQGENEKEIVVRNNSKSTLELKSLFSETRAVAIDNLPAIILPGQQLQLWAKRAIETNNLNIRDNLVIPFAHPVDGMVSLSFTAILNYVEADEKR